MSENNNASRVALFLDVCSKIEGLCAELYRYYSELFQEDEECSRLWEKTAREEEHHQQLFELAGRLQNECKFELVSDHEKAVRVYNKLTALLAYVRQSPPDIFLAITKAIEMEEALADLHIESSVKIKSHEIKDLFKSLQEFDQGHIESLRHYQAVLFLPKSEMTG